MFVFFINNRLIENSALKKAIQSVYQNYLPKNTHPFVYIAIEMEPQNVDVNVHPTKKEVHLLQEEKVVEFVQKVVDNRLLGSNSSRTFYTQPALDVTLGFATSSSTPSSVGAGIPTPVRSVTGGNAREDGSLAAVAPYRLVRTDSRAQKITSFLGSSSSLAADRSHDEDNGEGDEGEVQAGRGQKRTSDALVTLGKKLEQRARKRRTTPLLTSVENLCNVFESKEHKGTLFLLDIP